MNYIGVPSDKMLITKDRFSHFGPLPDKDIAFKNRRSTDMSRYPKNLL